MTNWSSPAIPARSARLCLCAFSSSEPAFASLEGTLTRGIDDHGEIGGLQRSASDEPAVDVGGRENLCRILRIYRAAVKNSYAPADPRAEVFFDGDPVF